MRTWARLFLTTPGRLRRLTFGLGQLKKKSGHLSGRLDFGLCENKTSKRIETERNKKKLPCAPALPLAQKTKALKGHESCFASVVSLSVFKSLV